MKKLLSALFIIIPVLLSAQVPGYQGKRFILSYNLDVLPNLSYFYLNLDQSVPVQILFGNHLNAEYVLGRRFSLAADLSYANNKSFIADGNALVTNMTYGLNVIFYPNHENTLAPVGNYFKMRFYKGETTGTGTSVYQTADALGYQHTITANEKAVLNDYGIGISFGNNMVVKDKVVLTASINLDYNFLTFRSASGNNDYDYAWDYDLQKHELFSYLFYLKLGIGGLLF